MSIRTLLLPVILAVCLPLQANKVIDQVVWIVGDEPILRSDIETEVLRQRYENTKIEGDPYCVIPEQIALQKLFIAGAKLDSLTVSEGAIDQQVETRIRFFIQRIGSKEKVEEYFNKPLAKIKEELRQTVEDQLLMQEMQRNIVKSVKVTPADVRRYYDFIPRDSIPTLPEMVEVQILTQSPKITAAETERVKSQLREFREKVESGAYQFSTLAILYSEDRGSAMQGGELGFMTRGKLVPEFANAAFSLYDTEKVSRIVETEFGFHIIQLIERRNDQVNCRHILLVPRISNSQKEAAMARLDSIAGDIRQGKFSFDDAAVILSEDKDTRQNGGYLINPNDGSVRFQIQDLPAEIGKVVYGMQVGEISRPFVFKNEKGKEVVAIVKLKERIKSHLANPVDDFQLLKDYISGQKSKELIEAWIRKSQQETYIYIDPEYRDCDFHYPNWIHTDE
ncbi:MAG: peptidylprolyl isomerase [Paludibacteraceae bacterium]|nr:peptidylprolyl isomerase [Paludibacteraceae bacterium]